MRTRDHARTVCDLQDYSDAVLAILASVISRVVYFRRCLLFGYILKMEQQLISKVKKHEVLYNSETSDYRNQQVRQDAWEEIALELNITAGQAKEKWEKLRRCFTNARNRRIQRKPGLRVTRKVIWKYEHQMGFLLPYLESRRIQRRKLHASDNVNLNGIGEQGVGEGNVECNDENFYGKEEERTANSPEREEWEEYEEKLRDLVNLKPEPNEQDSTPSIIDMTQNASLRNRESEEFCTQYTNSDTLRELDETDMFFLSMAKMTKRLPTIEQANIKLALSNAVLQAEIKYSRR